MNTVLPPPPPLHQYLKPARWVLLLSLLAWPGASFAASMSVVKAVTVTPETVEILLSAPATFQQAALAYDPKSKRPNRCYVDIFSAALSRRVHSQLKATAEPIAKYVQRVRTGQFDPHTARVVLDLVSAQSCHVELLHHPDRIAITVGPVDDVQAEPVVAHAEQPVDPPASPLATPLDPSGAAGLPNPVRTETQPSGPSQVQVIDIPAVASREQTGQPLAPESGSMGRQPIDEQQAAASPRHTEFVQAQGFLAESAPLPDTPSELPMTRITRENMDQAESLLTPSTRWMVERGMPITVQETQKVEWPQAYADATVKFSPWVTLSDDGRELAGYVAGAPFPFIDLNDPLAGYKIMWNTSQNPYITDNAGTDFSTELVNRHGEVEKLFTSRWRRMAWTGRLYLDPKPTVPYNPALRHTTLLGPMTSPATDKGASVLTLSYAAANIPDDTYLYLPQLRRVRRIGIANRGEAVWGTDVDVDSFWGFAAKLSYWSFRVITEKDILAVVHSGKYGDSSVWCAPRDGQHGFLGALPCVLWEKRRVWVIEATPTGYPRSYAYSKRILYIDQDFYAPLIQEMYDQHGELWKALHLCFFATKSPYWGYPIWPVEGGTYQAQEEWPFIPNGLMIDLQQEHATTFDAPSGKMDPFGWKTEWYFNTHAEQNTADVYSTNYLIRSAR
jgi:hypothetical protein